MIFTFLGCLGGFNEEDKYRGKKQGHQRPLIFQRIFLQIFEPFLKVSTSNGLNFF